VSSGCLTIAEKKPLALGALTLFEFSAAAPEGVGPWPSARPRCTVRSVAKRNTSRRTRAGRGRGGGGDGGGGGGGGGGEGISQGGGEGVG